MKDKAYQMVKHQLSTDIYIDITNGNDSSGDGSAATPYQTFRKAFDNANGGDTIWMGDSAEEEKPLDRQV